MNAGKKPYKSLKHKTFGAEAEGLCIGGKAIETCMVQNNNYKIETGPKFSQRTNGFPTSDSL